MNARMCVEIEMEMQIAVRAEMSELILNFYFISFRGTSSVFSR
jgi:hypothetical protein